MDISEKFDELREKGEAGLIIYTTIGFPSLSESIENIKKIAEAGADMIELGVPFSDPLADGPVIQHSSQIALKNGINLKTIINAVKDLTIDIPIILMSYINPLLSYGKEALFKDLSNSGVNGIIIPDLPVEESYEWISMSEKYNIDNIFLVTRTSNIDRVKKITELSRGFIYCVNVIGTTGARGELPEYLDDFFKSVRKQTHKPIAAGFGVSNKSQIKKLASKVDGIIIGSKIIELIEKKKDFISTIKRFKNAIKEK